MGVTLLAHVWGYIAEPKEAEGCNRRLLNRTTNLPFHSVLLSDKSCTLAKRESGCGFYGSEEGSTLRPHGSTIVIVLPSPISFSYEKAPEDVFSNVARNYIIYKSKIKF